MDNIRFQEISDMIVNSIAQREGIGTLSEKTLHAVLKNYYEADAMKQEIKVGSKYADIFNEQGIIEIQTKQFNKLRGKLDEFLPKYSVTIVYPIPYQKWLYWIDETTGQVSKGRRSPKKGNPYIAFAELYKIKQFLDHPNLHIRLVMLDIEEYRFLNGWSSNRKKGSSCSDRIPTRIEREIDIIDQKDYRFLIPEELPEEFTSKEFAKYAGIPVSLAQTGLNILYHIQVVDRIGKKGRLYLYQKRNT
ncbi:MAG TPA: hypothetical protein VHP81_05565 [Lachnospiraceae bacterium]|nr:hypothetical protein [Lachnospiraceae bacterium]